MPKNLSQAEALAYQHIGCLAAEWIHIGGRPNRLVLISQDTERAWYVFDGRIWRKLQE